MSDIWYRDVVGFLDMGTMLHIFPKDEMSYAEKLNALFRLSLIVSVLMLALTNDANTLLFAVAVACVTSALNYAEESSGEAAGDEAFETKDAQQIVGEEAYEKAARKAKRCTFPTRENPFMNVLMHEYTERPERRAACDMNRKVNKYVKKYFDENLYRSIDDVYHKNSSDRQFYTMPSTTIPNGQDDFARWLYRIEDKTCKEGNGLRCKYFS